jgi:glycerophosphoryl diester phosphodiesterase
VPFASIAQMTLTTEIIAHRGVPREARENTLASFRLALAQGADGIELDVHKTRDGVLVVHHDPVVRAVDPDGGQRTRAIAELVAPAVLDPSLPDGGRLPTLDSVLDLVQSQAVVYVEAKATGIAEALVECFDRHPSVRVAVHSFDHRIPVSVRALRPNTPIGVLSTSYPISLADFISGARPDAYWQQADMIDADLVRAAHACACRVIAWTVNDPDQARALIALGVDGLCTDTPGTLRSALLRSPINMK